MKWKKIVISDEDGKNPVQFLTSKTGAKIIEDVIREYFANWSDKSEKDTGECHDQLTPTP